MLHIQHILFLGKSRRKKKGEKKCMGRKIYPFEVKANPNPNPSPNLNPNPNPNPNSNLILTLTLVRSI